MQTKLPIIGNINKRKNEKTMKIIGKINKKYDREGNIIKIKSKRHFIFSDNITKETKLIKITTDTLKEDIDPNTVISFYYPVVKVKFDNFRLNNKGVIEFLSINRIPFQISYAFTDHFLTELNKRVFNKKDSSNLKVKDNYYEAYLVINDFGKSSFTYENIVCRLLTEKEVNLMELL